MAKPRNVLYRHYDVEGLLLYVGITNNIAKRTRDHACKSSWYCNIAYIELEYYRFRKSVLKAELRAIRHERPLYNTQHKI